MPSKTGQRLTRLVAGAVESLANLIDGVPGSKPVERNAASLEDLERLNVARLKQAEQIFEFEVLVVDAKASVDALRFFDLLLAALLAAQLVSGVLLLGRPDAPAATLVVLGVAVALVCWALAVTSWAETWPINGTFLADLASDPAAARAAASIRAAGVAKRNEGRRQLKGRLFALAVALTVADFAWAGAAHVWAAAPPAPIATAAPSPAPAARPSPAPRATPHSHRQQRGRKPRPQASRTNSSR
jgi:hypothetical protein